MDQPNPQENNIEEYTVQEAISEEKNLDESIPKLTLAELIYGVIFSPASTFSYIRHYDSWGRALIFLLAINIILTLLNALGSDWDKILSSLPIFISSYIGPIRATIGLFIGIFLFPLSILLFMLHTGFLHILAEMLGGRGKVLGLFSVMAFAQIISVFNGLSKFFIGLVANGYWIYFPLGAVFSVWQIVVTIIGIRENYLISSSRATLIFFMPLLLVFFLFLFMLITGVSFFAPLVKGIPVL